MKKVFIIHGFEGSPNGAWRPWLMAELEKQDTYACALSMPAPEKPVLSEWLDEMKRHITANIQDEIYLVGHSLGGTVILRYLEKYTDVNIKGAIMVSAPCEKTQNRKIEGFLETSFDYETIKQKTQSFAVIHGDDDPFVKVADAETIAKGVGGKLILIPGGKHLNGGSGCFELPECRDVLFEMMNNS
jgi:uncharacterized protein